ncbi:MAG: hypothetical protein WA705_27750 [Candidatus Ozemobacteraceae bacterium]
MSKAPRQGREAPWMARVFRVSHHILLHKVRAVIAEAASCRMVPKLQDAASAITPNY